MYKEYTPHIRRNSRLFADLEVTVIEEQSKLDRVVRIGSWAKEAGEDTSLVLSFIQHYILYVKEPLLANSFTIFYWACLLGSL